MVGPTYTEEDKAALSRRLQAGFVLLVGASGGLVALQAEPTLLQLGTAVLAGLLVGLGLLWFLLRTAREL